MFELAKKPAATNAYTSNNQDTKNVLGIYSIGKYQEPSNIIMALSKECGLLINYQHSICNHVQTLLRDHDYSVRLLRVIEWDFSSPILRQSHPELSGISGRDLVRVEVQI
jgi:hypothetical protein